MAPAHEIGERGGLAGRVDAVRGGREQVPGFVQDLMEHVSDDELSALDRNRVDLALLRDRRADDTTVTPGSSHSPSRVGVSSYDLAAHITRSASATASAGDWAGWTGTPEIR